MVSADSTSHKRRRLFWVLKLSVSVAIIAILLNSISLDRILTQLSTVSLPWLVLSGAIMVAQFWIGAIRWVTVIEAIGGRLSQYDAFRCVYVGQFFNLVLPSSIGGDAVRMWMLYKARFTASQAASSVLIDRLAALVGLVLSLFGAYMVFPIQTDQPLALTVWALLGGMLAGCLAAMNLDKFPRRLRGMKAFAFLVHLAEDVRAVLLHPKNAILALGVGVFGQINLSAALWIMAIALGIDVTLAECMVLWPLVVLATLLPLTIFGWGIREGAMVIAFGLVGVEAESALLLSMLWGVLNIVIALPGGAFWLAAGTEMRRSSQRAGLSEVER